MERIYELTDGGDYPVIRAYGAVLPEVFENAAFGMFNMILKLQREETPDAIIAVFDPSGPTLKHKLNPDYKANREKTPDDLIVQIPYVHRALAALGLPVLVVPGVEADDVIGTLAHRYEGEGDEVTIVTGDKDFCQLVGPRTRLLDTMKNRITDEAAVVEMFEDIQPPEIVVANAGAAESAPIEKTDVGEDF